jgi:hypothetical protein
MVPFEQGPKSFQIAAYTKPNPSHLQVKHEYINTHCLMRARANQQPTLFEVGVLNAMLF